jgi:hypothetical protein
MGKRSVCLPVCSQTSLCAKILTLMRGLFQIREPKTKGEIVHVIDLSRSKKIPKRSESGTLHVRETTALLGYRYLAALGGRSELQNRWRVQRES